MKNKKRWLALGLVGIMTLGCFAGCGSKSDGKSADGKGDSSKGSVYYLNFKPEQDEQWQQLAKDLMSSGVYPASFNNVLFVIIPYVSITYPIPATESPSFSA